MAAERKHTPVDPDGARRLGFLGASDSLEAKTLRARFAADKAFRDLSRAEAAAAAIIPPEGVDPRGEKFSDDQLRRDATRLGYAGHTASSAHVTTRDPAVAEAAQRVRSWGEQRAAADELEQARSVYERAALSARSFEADLAKVRHKAAVDEKARQLDRVNLARRERPTDGALELETQKLQDELDFLVRNPPK
jgi:hypothetical protein